MPKFTSYYCHLFLGSDEHRNYDDPSVCKMFLKGVCLHDLFAATKKDAGICPKAHNEKFKMQYDDIVAKRGLIPSIEAECERTIHQCIVECDAKIEALRKKLKQSQEAQPLPATLKPETLEKVIQISELFSKREARIGHKSFEVLTC